MASPISQKSSTPKLNADEMSQKIVSYINDTLTSLKAYPIRQLVKDAEEFGPELRRQRLETNQIRKFLDALNQIKAKVAGSKFSAEVETEIVLLKPKLAYAAARQDAVKPLSHVMSAAIDKTHDKDDFDRLVQLVESIIAYHKAEGGK